MTCIAAVRDGDEVVLGADSAMTSGATRLSVGAEAKIIRIRGLLVGVSGDPRVRHAMGYRFAVPKHRALSSPLEYISGPFVRALATRLRRDRLLSSEGLMTQYTGLLIAYQNKIFRIYPNFYVHESLGQYDAIGSGGEIATGCLFATAGTQMSGVERVKKALDAAQAFDCSVRSPFVIITASTGRSVNFQ